MRRSPWLVAATSWLLGLAACGDQPSAKAPHAERGSHHVAASHVASRRPSAGPAAESFSAQGPASADGIARLAAGPEAARDTFVTSDQLALRYGRARALAAQVGSGSYYSDAFAGRPTASGAAYEPRGFTAAHRSFPFGTVLRVTRSDGGQSVYVRVTDRGPYGPRGRILDLSHAAAERLGMLRAGVVKIKVEVVEYGPRKPTRRRRR